MIFFAHVKKYAFFYIITFLLLLSVAASFFRFTIDNSYTIYDEFECDPAIHSCFVYCEDDECTEPFYYAEVERDAAEVLAFCNGDITDCDAMYECQPTEQNCIVSFCDGGNSENECVSLSSTNQLTN